MTEKLYYTDSHIKRFQAQVVSCTARADGWAIELDKTAFFPEGGGQPGDIGYIGSIQVTDTHEVDGRILHYTDGPVDVGSTVTGEIDWLTRFRRMQNHSGEHIVSGLICALHGLNNVGFHIGAQDVTIDFDGELTRRDIDEIELRANLALAENLPVETFFPSPEALKTINYRSKIELDSNIRIVKIGDYDTCACCAPHVKHTGQIGIIKLLDFSRHRGGIRIHMLCGLDALDDYSMRLRATSEISAMLSAKQNETPLHVRRVLDELESMKCTVAALKRRLVEFKISAISTAHGNLCLFEPELDPDSLRELACAASKLCGGVCAAFRGSEGQWKYVIASTEVDLTRFSGAINAAIGGRGGGRRELLQGSASFDMDSIKSYFENTCFQ